jgi:hypothetical protein
MNRTSNTTVGDQKVHKSPIFGVSSSRHIVKLINLDELVERMYIYEE